MCKSIVGDWNNYYKKVIEQFNSCAGETSIKFGDEKTAIWYTLLVKI